jgi:hypothetical protein
VDGKLTETLGSWLVVVDNRVGAGGMGREREVVAQVAAGRLHAHEHTEHTPRDQNPGLFRKLPYDSLRRFITAIGLVATSPNVLRSSTRSLPRLGPRADLIAALRR